MLEKNQKYIDALNASVNEQIDYEMLREKTFFITGATGLVGKALVDYLFVISRKYDLHLKVIAAGRSEENFRNRFADSKDLTFFKHDICSKMEYTGRIDYIIHAASNADPKSFAKDSVGTMTANFLGMYNILEYAKENDVKRVLFVSSGEVYGQWDGVCEAFDETYSGYVNISDYRGCYPTSKRAAENLLVCYMEQYGVDGIAVRLSHTFGATQLKRDSRAMSEFFTLAVSGEDIVLKSLGLPIRSYTCVFDAVSGIVCALLNGKGGEAYNVANKDSIVSIAELAEKIAACAGRSVVFDIPDGGVKGASSITRGVLDAGKLESIGWVPLFNIDEGIRVTYEIMEEEYERNE